MSSIDYKKKKKNLELLESKEGGTHYHQVFWERLKTDPVQLNKDGLSWWWKQVEKEFLSWRECNQCILNK